MNKNYTPNQDLIRIAAATPEVSVANIPENVSRISSLFDKACERNVSLTVFPELSITGYTIGDLVMQSSLLEQAEEGLLTLAEHTKDKNSAMIVGLPIQVRNGVYNSAAFLADGEIIGIVPKTNLPTYKEFYEKRWYQSWSDKNIFIDIGNKKVPFGIEQIFKLGSTAIGIEICEDLWVSNRRSIELAAQGAEIIANPSASPEIVTKSDYRKKLVATAAGVDASAYIYAGADPSESTADIVMSGHAIINELGRQVAERKAFDQSAPRLTVADIDISHIKHDRRLNTNYEQKTGYDWQQTNTLPTQTTIEKSIDTTPFLPKGTQEDIDARLDEILQIQAFALKKRMDVTGIKKVIIGLSGGSDSLQALLVAIRTAQIRGKKVEDMIETLTMPSFASSKRTQSNAVKLAEALGIPNKEIPIGDLSVAQMQAFGHDGEKQDVTFENTQARIRTALQFNVGNMNDGLVLGTGDMSEIALGWCTYAGDQTSSYNVNASIPKTLIKSLIDYANRTIITNPKAKEIIQDILNTPVSPELTGDGSRVSQETEKIVGPYELHDFFLYNYMRWMDKPEKIGYLAREGFKDKYDEKTINKWLVVFLKRFAQSQWKRQAMPDGPKVGTISLSPRGDLRMPPDADFSNLML